MRSLIFVLLLSFTTTLSAAELPSLGQEAKAWAASLGHGAVAAAVKLEEIGASLPVLI